MRKAEGVTHDVERRVPERRPPLVGVDDPSVSEETPREVVVERAVPGDEERRQEHHSNEIRAHDHDIAHEDVPCTGVRDCPRIIRHSLDSRGCRF